jgi:hypothetical protein
MPCLLAILAFAFPRLVILLLALFSQYMSSAYNTLGWPLLGFFFAPYTTLAYAVAMNENSRTVDGWALALVIVAVLFDLGALGGGGRAAKRRKKK